MSSTQRVAIVTGCGKRDGIGAAIARRLASQGIAVVVTDIAATGVRDRFEQDRPETAQWKGVDDLAAEIAQAGGDALALTGDISSKGDVDGLIAAVATRFGQVDILVNNAGAPFSMAHGDVADIDPAEFDRVMQINVTGTFLMSQAAIPFMRAGKWGRIVNVASVAGRVGSKANSAYAASKAGVIALAQTFALDLGGDGITANAVLPGFIFTSRTLSGMSKKMGGVPLDEETIARSKPSVPVGRDGTPEDIAATVAFLVSEDAAFTTGQSFIVDGGSLRL
ncbi:SDR family NAD(P)-dependent oxidoreductase [Novosphingobium lindaniclasticum]|uniref:Short-chain dehydrogenase n=1 Tax=Novosphingobium lindaniclasticum LE124 TaxID=1096930 RepID=T0IR81_9SPHN|nr:SDR family NAD(P)-dependent oxidoreductase [Novosphingobium lindaniclasticum]EQB14325.1 hypothetical protein L284_13090 [Novosphingobium lindaniclasticum LE124]